MPHSPVRRGSTYATPVALALKAPVFVVGAPFSGDAVLVDALSRASGVYRSHTDDATFLDVLPGVDPARRGWHSHRLTEEDAGALGAEVAEALVVTLRDREGRPPAEGTREGRPPVERTRAPRVVAGGPRLALRVPLLATAFPDATFVITSREPQEVVPEMVAAWQSGRFVTCPELPGWDGPPWSLPLIPGWSRLAGRPVEEIAVEQWTAITELLLDDLESLAPGRWAVCDVGALLADPREVLGRLCRFLQIDYDQALLTPVELARRSLPADRAAASERLGAELPRAAAAAARARELIAAPDRGVGASRPNAGASPPGAGGSRPGAGASRPGAEAEPSPFRSVSTASFARTLAAIRSSLIVSTYQSGKLICARDSRGLLNTHFRDFDKPMGIGVASGRFALATRSEVWDFRDIPAVAGKLEPPGTHDACFIPRNRHLTGDVLAHEIAFADGELWLVATAFSCLATLDSDHSFVPRWTPSFISSLAPEDRCHLNGLAVVDGTVGFVTALGQTDAPQGWRKGKADGGCVIDVRSGEIVCAGLSMPHSPRWHDDRLWVLESGRGSIATVDPSSGAVETVIELPGFTRGLALAGHLAFVGLSQIRESSTFGDLPLTKRLNERVAGVWIVDLRRPVIAGFLRFEDIVQELFDVALLPGARFPEIAEPVSTAATTSFVLP